MKNNRKILSGLIIMLVGVIYLIARAQQKQDAETKDLSVSHGPNSIVRNVIQDRKGNIWMAAFDGIFKYDGKSFTNVTGNVSSAGFFSILDDRKGGLWFGSIGSGAYYYDGKSFRNFTDRDGLAGNSVTCIYEDRTGNIWFATGNGVSRSDGKSLPTGQAGFRNFTTKDGLPDNDINAIIEDRTGKFWFGTAGDACIYDGKKFTILTHEVKSFANVRSIIEDKKGNIWLGGNDGLWRYDGHTFTNYTKNFVAYIYEDKKGNIWTSSENRHGINANLTVPLTFGADSRDTWLLSRYDEKTLSEKRPTVTEITPKKGMIAAIAEANDGSIWFGGSDGVYRYDGKTVMGFNGNKKRR